MFDVYWANSLFSQADRTFNNLCVVELRKRGFDVFLPQEIKSNKSKSPTESEIFENDTHAIKNCRIFVACIDQETIDCGVACEIGIAHSFGKFILGYYTDIRKDRTIYKMYKNPYVIGAIMSSGMIVNTIEELIVKITEHLNQNR